MYILEQFADGYAKVKNTDFAYHSNFRVNDQAEATLLVADLNKPALKAQLQAYRYQIETTGLITDQGVVQTDRQSQSQLSNAYATLQNGLINETRWKMADGWVTLNQEAVAPIAQAVAAHISQCFSAENDVQDEIDAIDNNDDILAFDVSQAFDAIYSPANLATEENLDEGGQ